MKETANGTSMIAQNLPSVDVEKLLAEKGYGSDDIRTLIGKDVLFLSLREQTLKSNEKVELLTPETVEAKKVLGNSIEKLNVEFALDKRKEHRYLELLHAEIYVGLIVFLNPVVWDVCKGIVSNWIYDKFKAMKQKSKTLDADIEIQIIDRKKGRSFHVKYSGPANEVAEIIKKAKFE